MEIKKGNRYVCVKDVVMEGVHDVVAYIKGNVYTSESDNCITNKNGNSGHRWKGDGEEFFFIPYSKLDRVYTKYTERLYKMYLEFNSYKKEVISKNVDRVFFDNMNMDGETGVFGWSSGDNFALDYGAVYLSEEAFIEFMGLEETVKEVFNPQKHYDNSKGSLYKVATDLGLNHWEFDIFKRLVRCRKKNQFEQDLQKIKDTIDIYLKEYK